MLCFLPSNHVVRCVRVLLDVCMLFLCGFASLRKAFQHCSEGEGEGAGKTLTLVFWGAMLQDGPAVGAPSTRARASLSDVTPFAHLRLLV